MGTGSSSGQQRLISREELESHEEGCWVKIDDFVYDFEEFLEDHPAGPEAITELVNRDGTSVFLDVHTMTVLEDFDDCIVGKFVEDQK